MTDDRPEPEVLLTTEEAEELNRELQDVDGVVFVDSEWHDYDDSKANVNNGLSFCWQFCWRDAREKLRLVYMHNYGDSACNVHVLRPFWTSDVIKSCHNIPADWHILANHGIRGKNFRYDTMVMDYLLDEANREYRHGLKDCAWDFLKHKRADFKKTFWRPMIKMNGEPYANNRLEKVDLPEYIETHEGKRTRGIPNILVNYACDDSYDGLKLFEKYKPMLEAIPWRGDMNYWDYFVFIESRITEIICDVERMGMPLDIPFLKEMSAVAETELEKLDADIVRISGFPINPGSDVQLAALLFGTKPHHVKGKRKALNFTIEGWGLPEKSPKTKSGKASTDQTALLRLKGFALENDADELADFLDMLIKRSAISTQIGTFFRGLQAKQVNGRIHTRINQIGTVAGRFSCVASWTGIRTMTGVIPIAKIKVGDYVWTHRQRWRPVLAKIRKGIDSMYSVRFCNGEVLNCTIDHRLLSLSGEWLTLREIIDGDFEDLGRRQAKSDQCITVLSEPKAVHNRTDCREARGNEPEHSLGSQTPYVRGGVQGLEEVSILRSQDGRQEPYERDERCRSSQLERAVRRRGWISDMPVERTSSPCAQSSNDAGVGADRFTEPHGGAPHRQRQEEQPYRQSGFSYEEGSLFPPLLASEGLAVREIEEIKPCGSLEVYDLTVHEDASYEACGVFSHNSSGPNLQNITTGRKDLFFLRDCFRAPPGYVLIVADYGQLEYRLLAHFTQDPLLLKMFREGLDMHSYTSFNVFDYVQEDVLAKFGGPTVEGLQYAKKTYKEERDQSKTVNFGVIYGQGGKSLADRLGIPHHAGKAMVKGWFNTYTYVKPWQRRQVAQARDKGFVRTILGRYRRPVVSKLNSDNHGVRGHQERSIVNGVIQGSAADVCETAMRLLYDDEWLRDIGYRMVNQIHDEIVAVCPIGPHKEATRRVEEIMRNPFSKPLRVDLPVDAGYGPTWETAKV